MGVADLVFNGVLVVLAAVLTLSAASSWTRTRCARYFVIGALCGLTALGWGVAMLSSTTPLEQWIGTLLILLVCALVLRSSQRSDAAVQDTQPEHVEPGSSGPEAH